MKIALFVAVACGLMAGSTALAKQRGEPVVVVAEPVSFPAWTSRTTRLLEQQMSYPHYLTGVTPREGVVRISFRCSEAGKPTAVAVQDSSGFHEIDAAALRAVSRIATLHPLPEGLSPQQRYQAVLLFASSPESYDRQIDAIRKDVARRNAWFGSKGTPIAMGVGLMPAG